MPRSTNATEYKCHGVRVAAVAAVAAFLKIRKIRKNPPNI